MVPRAGVRDSDAPDVYLLFNSEFTMKKFAPILLICLGTSGAFAQTAADGVTVSNDPAKAAAVEQHAQELKAQQQARTSTMAKSSKTAVKSKAKKKTARAKPTTMK